jgi:uncharacterized protein YhaN
MNLVGKILTGMICVMSLVFMTFAVMVYATHKNWRQVVERTANETPPGETVGLKHLIADLKAQNTQLKDEREKLDAEVAAERTAKDEALKKLRAERDELQKQRDTLDQQLAELQKNHAEAVATVKTSTDALTDLTGEVAKLRDEIRAAQDDRDKRFRAVVELTDQNNQMRGQLTSRKERMQQLAAQVASFRDVLNKHGWKEGDSDPPPAALKGEVLAINANGMIEVSAGADDGLRKGHTLEISRQSKYLGRIEIISTTTDRAVGKILPGFKKAPIQRGDHVSVGISKAT